MADIEEAEGNHGAVREWLGRAARAPRDKAWVADGVISDRWAPVSPSGTLDGFVWRTPDERLAAPAESAPPPSSRRRLLKRSPRLCPRSRLRPRRSRRAPRSEPAPAPTVVPPLRSGVIIDPVSMAPDDPGPQEQESKPRRSWLYANE